MIGIDETRAAELRLECLRLAWTIACERDGKIADLVGQARELSQFVLFAGSNGAGR